MIYIKNAACEKQSYRRRLLESGFFQFFFCSETFVRIGNLLLQFFYFYDCLFRIFSDFIADSGKQKFCIFNFFEIESAVNGKYMHRRSRYLCVASRNLKNRNAQFHGRDNIDLHHLVVLSSYLSFVKKSFFLNQYAGEADHIWE